MRDVLETKIIRKYASFSLPQSKSSNHNNFSELQKKVDWEKQLREVIVELKNRGDLSVI